jgi:hypothetical protein
VITTDSAKDVKVVVGSIMVVGKVVVYVVRLADAEGIVLNVDRLENEAEGERVNDACEEDLVEPGSVPEGINTDPLLVVYHSCCADIDAEDMSGRSKARSTLQFVSEKKIGLLHVQTTYPNRKVATISL